MSVIKAFAVRSQVRVEFEQGGEAAAGDVNEFAVVNAVTTARWEPV
jgi:hypothetical protein